MSTLLLDASAILAAFDSEDDLHEAAQAVLADPEVTLATLDLARYEVANGAVRAWRDPAQVSPLLEAIDRISDDGGVMLATTTLLQRAAELAEQHGISASRSREGDLLARPTALLHPPGRCHPDRGFGGVTRSAVSRVCVTPLDGANT